VQALFVSKKEKKKTKFANLVLEGVKEGFFIPLQTP
jgi:hypothetical protein